jgi:hypothetical protein
MRIPELVGTVTALLMVSFSTATSAVEVSSGFLLPRDSWQLMGAGLTAQGDFTPGNTPGGNFEGPLFSGQPVDTGWTSGSVDGWSGTMILNGMLFNLNSSDEAAEQSVMTVTASGFTVDHSGMYQQPFAFSADFCGWMTFPNAGPCDANVSLSGNGTVSMVVEQIPGDPEGTFAIEDIGYSFGNATQVPEPGSLSLLTMGIALMLMGFRRRLRSPTR